MKALRPSVLHPIFGESPWGAPEGDLSFQVQFVHFPIGIQSSIANLCAFCDELVTVHSVDSYTVTDALEGVITSLQ